MEDGGVPPRSRTAILTVNMLRNLNAPQFVEGTYEAEIQETHNIGASVLRIRATDSDNKVGNLIVYIFGTDPLSSLQTVALTKVGYFSLLVVCCFNLGAT